MESYVGIGTSVPNHPLEVEGQVFISNVEQGSNTNEVPFEVYSDYSGSSPAILRGARQLRLRVTPWVTTSANVNMDMGIEPTNGDYFYISNPVVDTPLGSNAAFRITQAGNVSMGSNLSVTGSITSSALSVSGVLDVNESNIIAYANVGIGTIDPQKPLHVMGNALITGSLTTPSIVGATLSSPTLINPVVPGGLSVSGTLTSVTPTTLVTGSLSSNVSAGDVLYAGEFLGDYNAVGIGITNPGYRLQLSLNSAAKPSSSAWFVTSDRRIKEDIIDADLDTCLENVKNLKLRYYKLRDDIIELDPMFNDSHKLGWIAQEVEEILPKCVTTIPEQYGLTNVKNLDVDQIYVNMFGTLQKLIKENEELQLRIEALENK